MKTRSNALFRGIVSGLFCLIAAPVFAHHPTIQAEAVCDAAGQLTIEYVSTSWQTTGEPGSGNSQIDILINGVKVDQGAYVAPTYSFSGSAPAPAGTSATVSAVAVGEWDGGTPGGGTAESVTVTYPTESCSPPVGVGRFTGGGFQVRVGDTRVTRGLTIHCDLILSNNLEVNWGGNKFHMTEHLQTVRCS